MERIKKIGQIKAQLLADYILQVYGPMSHLKIQKLIYYCEAYHLAYTDTSIIEEDFQAWVHGPVCREVFDNLKDTSILHSDISIEINESEYNPKQVLKEALTSEQLEIIHDVLEELTTWSGLELENATHNESPWIEARKGYSPGDRCEVIISKDEMKKFYKKEINA